MNSTHYINKITMLFLLGLALPLHAQTIKGNIYGGGEMAIVDGDTHVTLNTGDIEKDVFGGGEGDLNDEDHTVKVSADVTGTANVTLNGSNFTFPTDGIDPDVNHNIYGGGNLASVVGATNVTISKGLLPADFLEGDSSSPWGKWIGAVNAQDDNIAQGSVFGGGYGVNTVVIGTAKVVVNVDESVTRTAMVDVIGGGYNGYVLSNTEVTVEGVPEIYTIYGGGLGSQGGYNESPTTARSHENLTTYTMQQTIGSVGENKEDDGTSLIIKGGKFYNNIFGGGAGLKYQGETSYLNVAEVFGKTNVTIDAIDGWTGEDANHAFGHSIYGGGALGLVNDEILVDIKSGTFNGAELFAGSLGEKGHLDKAMVTASATIRTSANDSDGALQGYFNIYGGCDMAQMKGDTHVELQHGTFSGNIFGAGKGLVSEETSPGVWEEYLDYGKVTGNTNIVIDEPSLFLGTAEGVDAQGMIIEETEAIKIYGGGALGLVDGIINPVTLRSGTLYGSVFGGSLGEKGHLAKAKVTGKTGVRTEPSTVNTTGGMAAALLGKFNIYGGCDMAQVDSTSVMVTHGSFSGTIYGGGNGISSEEIRTGEFEQYMEFGKVTGKTDVLIDGANLNLTTNVYGGGALGKVGEDTKVTVENGKITGTIYGGSFGEEGFAEKAIIQNNTYVNINGGTITGNVFGGGALAKVDKDTYVNIISGSVSNEVYGGGALADVNKDTYVYLFGGTVHDVYGGGLGQLADAEASKQAVEALVKGNTLVQLGHNNKTTSQPEGSIVTGSIFGCNNVNGTPKGHAKVHVLKTTQHEGQTSPHNAEGDNVDNSYDVLAVYGGGNKAAYQPWTQQEITALGTQDRYKYNESEFAEVLIDSCYNSIAYVYGGGNAAPVPSTKVTIYGADAINHAFAGGNGAGDGNPGADVGYLDYYSTPTPAAREYGTGKASITVYGGTVHNVYGGSNTLGYIRGGTTVSVTNASDDPESPDYYAGTICPLNVGHVYGGGNEADINCDVTINCDCSEGGQILYAGANNADVNGSITLNIHSGTYGQVFCGNNQGGAVKGKLEVNVDETGCWPVMIGELYGCGNMAPYSVYGYEVDSDGKTLRDSKGQVKVITTSDTKLYDDPVVNLISFTRIGKVFGGGYGATAVLYGNTHVSVEPIKGIFATGKSVAPLYVLDGSDERVLLTDAATMPYGVTMNDDNTITIAEDAGSIGSIFGGGNAGAVYGNTNVEIGLKEENVHMNDFPTTDKEVAVTITGDVFGGGEKAIVSGNTNVKIGE